MWVKNFQIFIHLFKVLIIKVAVIVLLIKYIYYLRCGLLESLVALMELPEDQSKDEHFADIDQTSGKS